MPNESGFRAFLGRLAPNIVWDAIKTGGWHLWLALGGAGAFTVAAYSVLAWFHSMPIQLRWALASFLGGLALSLLARVARRPAPARQAPARPVVAESVSVDLISAATAPLLPVVVPARAPAQAPIQLGRAFVRQTPQELVQLRNDVTGIQAAGVIKPFLGKWMALTGTVNDISDESSGDISVVLVVDERMHFEDLVFLRFEADPWRDHLEVLRKGDPITVEGQIEGVRWSVTLGRCELK